MDVESARAFGRPFQGRFPERGRLPGAALRLPPATGSQPFRLHLAPDAGSQPFRLHLAPDAGAWPFRPCLASDAGSRLFKLPAEISANS